MFPVKSFSTDIYSSVVQSFSALKTFSHIFLQEFNWELLCIWGLFPNQSKSEKTQILLNLRIPNTTAKNIFAKLIAAPAHEGSRVKGKAKYLMMLAFPSNSA